MARMNKERKIVDERTKEVVDRIDEILAKQAHKGDIPSPSKDVLSLALGTQDHPGQVRGVGKFITQTQYFHKPKQTSRPKVGEHEENAKQFTIMTACIKELEEELMKHKQNSQKSKSASSSEDVKLEDVVEEEVQGREKKQKVKSLTKGESCSKMITTTTKDGTPCQLAFGSIDNIVACGTIFDSSIKGDNVKVSIDVVVDGNFSLPIPSNEEENLLSQELGSHLLWPRNLVIIDKEKETLKSKRVQHFCSTTHLQNSPVALRCLLREVEHIGSAIQINVPIDVFGIQRKCYIMLEVLQSFCRMREISNVCIDAYMMYLYKTIVKSNALGCYKFLNAGSISPSAGSKESRAQLLIARLLGTERNQLLIFPYNSGCHWTLIIIDHSKSLVFSLDSLRNRLHDDIVEVVNMAFKICKKKKVTLKNVKCPKQPTSVECGYYVMRFMRDIIYRKSTSIEDIMKDAPSAAYTQDEIDIVRVEWAEFVGSHIYFA